MSGVNEFPKNGMIEVVNSDGTTKSKVSVDEYLRNKKLST